MNKIKMLLIILVFLCTPVLVQTQDIVEAIVAVVNDEFISLSEYKERHDNFYQMLKAQFQGEDFTKQYEALKNSLMDTMITELLLLQESRMKGIDVTEQLNAQINMIKEQNGFTSDEDLILALKRENINFEPWKENLELGLLQQAVIYSEVGRSIVVDDSELIGFYNQHLEDFREPEEYTIKAIYVSSDGKSEEEVQAKKREIDGKISAEEDMSILAAQYGEGPEKDAQGDLGSFQKGQMLPNMEQAVEGLQAGELTTWIEMPNGWYLLRLEGKKESRIKPFEEVRGDIETALFNEKNETGLQKYLVELKARSFIKILVPDPLDLR
ncbi:MAG: peptidyl-prolyl cis-trans isomerase [Candidatus Aminicenantes bacterium]|nr:peptidyl-prolyl cis-trans isomerase [Candidatus Aminicenantes bacterium]